MSVPAGSGKNKLVRGMRYDKTRLEPQMPPHCCGSPGCCPKGPELVNADDQEYTQVASIDPSTIPPNHPILYFLFGGGWVENWRSCSLVGCFVALGVYARAFFRFRSRGSTWSSVKKE